MKFSDAAHRESLVLTNLFLKNSKMNILKTVFFPAASWHKDTECTPILIAPSVDSYLDTVHKYQELVSNGYDQQLILYTHW